MKTRSPNFGKRLSRYLEIFGSSAACTLDGDRFGKHAVLDGDGRAFAEVALERAGAPA